MIVYEMILTYAISGTKDLCTLLAYLTKVIDPEDEIVCFNEISRESSFYVPAPEFRITSLQLYFQSNFTSKLE